jgi:hypothetical protein
VDIETEKTNLFRKSIQDLEEKLELMDRSISSQSDRIRHLLQQPDGTKLSELATDLIKKAPWLMLSIETLASENLQKIHFRLKELQHGVIRRNVVCPYHRSNNSLNYMRYMTVNISMPTRSIESSVITSSKNGIRQPHGHQNGRLPSLLFAG